MKGTHKLSLGAGLFALWSGGEGTEGAEEEECKEHFQAPQTARVAVRHVSLNL